MIAADFQRMLERAAQMKRQYPTWRMGQCYSNALNEIASECYEESFNDIFAKDIDPFYNDGNIGEFLAYIWNFHVEEEK